MQMLATYFFIALAISLVLTPICRAVVQRLGFVAKPTRDRWHTRPTALFGGVAIAITVLVLGVWIGPDPRLWQLIVCGALIVSFGLVDVLISLKASTKLITQITLDDLLLSPTARYRDYLSPGYVHGLVRRHHAGKADLGSQLWTILCLETWLRALPRWTTPVVA